MRRKLENPEIDLTQAFAAAMAEAGVPSEQMPRVVHDFENINQIERSHEYGSLIVHSLVTGQPRAIDGNAPNKGLIDNLPQGCCVEVPVLVDRTACSRPRSGRCRHTWLP
jgi:alpha-galactosidase